MTTKTKSKREQKPEWVARRGLRAPTEAQVKKEFQETVIDDPKYYGVESPNIDEETKTELRNELQAGLMVRDSGDNVPQAWRGSRRCVSFIGDQRCGRSPVSGGFSCSLHIDAANYAESKRRLLFLVDPALQALYEIVTSPFSKDDSRIRAAREILSRTIPAKTEQEIQVSKKPSDLSNLSTEQLLERADRVRATLFAQVERKKLAAEIESEVIDAEVTTTDVPDVETKKEEN